MNQDIKGGNLVIDLVYRYFCNRGIALIISISAVASASAAPTEQTAVFAGGCFWGVDAVFKHVKGVSEVVSGYAGGTAATAHYGQVSNGDTGHAESVRIRFDSTQVSYQQLLQVFLSVAHDPTQLNRQGPDAGTQYRSAIFYTSTEQQAAARTYIEKLNVSHAFPKPVVTQLVPLEQFYPAEGYHQNYLALHPNEPYIVFNDMPKLQQLRAKFPSLYQ
ncbi:MAG: peptide-methionine (S)-S-oxide reductase [Rhodocyclaceae bacterium]|nr:MAG: peptide-methionine (S)-S-oxide reductase [Rhodocyclaceae bacterium]